MKTYTIHLCEKREIATNTYAFRFAKPHDFSYHAGQYISLSVEKPEVAAPGGTMREFSVASAPYEDELLLAWRHRDTQAKTLFMDLKVGNTAYLQGPFGSFHLQPTTHPIVFLSGGIGIVPFLSMLKQALFEKWENTFVVFMSNRRYQDIPFLPELEGIQATAPNVTFINTLTLEPVNSQPFHSGYITPQMLKNSLHDSQTADYYISGPQRFVGGMWDVLETLGISDRNIHGEEFTGY